MKKNYLSPAIETLEINPVGVLMHSPDPFHDLTPTPPGAPKKRSTPTF